MKKSVSATMMAVALLTASLTSNEANAQHRRAIGHGKSKARVQQKVQKRVYLDPSLQQPRPRLGFQGQLLNGYGMKIVSVNWGSAAQRAGLEAGDVITKINGRFIRSQWDYDQALQNAARHNFGQLKMKVRNVRYTWGQNVPEYAQVRATLDGYGGGVYPQNGPPIQAYARN